MKEVPIVYFRRCFCGGVLVEVRPRLLRCVHEVERDGRSGERDALSGSVRTGHQSRNDVGAPTPIPTPVAYANRCLERVQCKTRTKSEDGGGWEDQDGTCSTSERLWSPGRTGSVGWGGRGSVHSFIV